MANKPQPTTERFNPASRPKREVQTERHFRNSLHKALHDLLLILNPADALSWRAMKYEDLVVYARDWLQTEVEQVRGKPSGAQTEPNEEVESAGLSLD